MVLKDAGLALGTLLLAACGGGGSSGSPPSPGVSPVPQGLTVGGLIEGLGSTRSLTLRLNGALQTFEGRNVQINDRQFTFSERLEVGDNFTVSVALLPLNQLCLLTGGTGTASASVSSIRIRCVDTRLNDSGVNDGADGSAGRDAVSRSGTLAKRGGGRLGFDFVRVCGSGSEAGSGSCPAVPTQGTGANEWACTRDVVMGALWQTAPSAASAYGGAEAAVASANAGSLCGRADWRLPTVIELSNLVDAGAAAADPAIDTAFFPGTPQAGFWTAEGRANDAAAAWAVEFASGAVGVLNRTDDRAWTRVVSGTARTSGLTFASETMFTDMGFALSWLVTGDTGTWSQALAAAGAANAAQTGGFSDWRLPNRNELSSLVERTRRAPSTAAAVGSRIAAQGYWTATPLQTATGVETAFSWVVDFDNGDMLPRPVTDTRRILLVRSIALAP